ncbi:MAG: acetate--CoA ligase family protein [Patescibacteria group bacterium]
MSKNLKSFFAPKSIAVIGASDHPGKVGNDVIMNLLKNYQGEIYPINPNSKTVAEKKAYPSILKTPTVPDLAIIVIHAESVIQTVIDCAKRGCRNLIIISSGFKEVGGEGTLREQKLVELTKKYKLKILGPNCLGYLATRPTVNASFAASFPKTGNVAFFSQSGALGTAILDMAEAQKLGLSYFVSLGNKMDLSELDLLEYFAEDKNTKVILAYLESITDGRKFIDLAKKVSKKKPIVVLKSGKTAEGGQAVSSHTGSLAGAAEVYSAAFKQSGVIEAEDVMDFFDLAEGFSYQDYPKGNRVAILTNAGGPGILLTDWLPTYGLQLAKLSATTQAKLQKVLPPASSTHNPVDVLGDALADRYGTAFEIIMNDPGVDSIIVALTPQRMTQIKETADIIGRLKKQTAKTVILCFMGELAIVKNYQSFADNREPQFNYPLQAVKALSKMHWYGEWQKKKFFSPIKVKPVKVSGLPRAGSGFITENICRDILSQWKFPLHRAEFVKDINQATLAAKTIGYPIALKVVSKEVVHKSDAGGVKIGIKDETELKLVIDEMKKKVTQNIKNAKIDGFIVGEMVKGQEVIIGLKRDPQFGTVIMLGLGGIYAETFKDVSFRIAPFSVDEAKMMIEELKIYPLLLGARGQKPADIDALAELLVKFANFSLANPTIKEIDFNPIMVKSSGSGCTIVDSRIML